MDDEKQFWIPSTLDAPKLFFRWEADSAILFIGVIVLGSLMGGLGMIFGVILATYITRTYSELKLEGGQGLIRKLVYWFTPSKWISERNPSHVREHIGN